MFGEQLGTFFILSAAELQWNYQCRLSLLCLVTRGSHFTILGSKTNSKNWKKAIWCEDVWLIKSSVWIWKDMFFLLGADCVLETNPIIFILTDAVETPFTTSIVYDRFELACDNLCLALTGEKYPFQTISWVAWRTWTLWNGTGIIRVPMNHHKKHQVLCRQRLPRQSKNKLLVTVPSNQKIVQ